MCTGNWTYDRSPDPASRTRACLRVPMGLSHHAWATLIASWSGMVVRKCVKRDAFRSAETTATARKPSAQAAVGGGTAVVEPPHVPQRVRSPEKLHKPLVFS